MEYTEELEEVQEQEVQDEYDFWHNEQDVF